MSDQIKACFNGCSFTEGEGFDESLREQYIYDRIVSKEHNFQRTNIAQKGSSNYTIFMRTARAIMDQSYDLVVTQWTALNRIWLSPGPDVYFFVNEGGSAEFNYKNIHLNKNEKKLIKDTLLLLNHDFQNILDLVDYCSILEQLGQKNSTKVVFINGLVPWKNDLLKPLDTDFVNSLSSYTRSMLDFEGTDDHEITKSLLRLQNKMSELNTDLWVNLFNSFKDNTIDLGPEGHHPGIKSHQWMSQELSNYLKETKL